MLLVTFCTTESRVCSVKLWAFSNHVRYCNAKVVGHVDERSGGEEASPTRALILTLTLTLTLILGIETQAGTNGEDHDGLWMFSAPDRTIERTALNHAPLSAAVDVFLLLRPA